MIALLARYTACLSVLHLWAQLALAEDNNMTYMARIAADMQSKLHPQILMPFSYNFNRNLGANSNINQDEFQFQPLIPLPVTSDINLILNPMLTGNLNKQNEQINNQAEPFQLATYLAFAYDRAHFGMGPYYQSPALNANGTPKQSGAGVSYGFYYRTTHWVIGGTGYNTWGIGNNTAAGTANLISMTPMISYTTNEAWTFNLNSAIKYNWNESRATNQMTLSAGKTTSLFGLPVEIQVGPTYMVTHTLTSAKGGGVFFKIAGSIDPKPN